MNNVIWPSESRLLICIAGIIVLYVIHPWIGFNIYIKITFYNEMSYGLSMLLYETKSTLCRLRILYTIGWVEGLQCVKKMRKERIS